MVARGGSRHAAGRLLLTIFLSLSILGAAVLGPELPPREVSAQSGSWVERTLVIRVLDADTGEPVGGARFGLHSRGCLLWSVGFVVDPTKCPEAAIPDWPLPPLHPELLPSLAVVDNQSLDTDPQPGRIVISGLAPTVYTVIQNWAPLGYAPDAFPQEINLGDGNGELVFRLRPVEIMTRDLVVYAYGDPEYDGHGSLLDGGAFQFCRVDPSGCADEFTVSDNGDGDADPTPGIIRVPGVQCDFGFSQSYTVTQLQVPAGYQAVATEPLTKQVCDTEETVFAFHHVREIARPFLLVKVLDAPTGIPIGGAQVTYCRQEEPPIVRCVEGTQVVVRDDGPGDVDNRPGSIAIRLFPEGFYMVWLTEMPDGWDRDTRLFANMTLEFFDVRTAVFRNERRPARLIIKRVDENQQPLGGSTVRVNNADGYNQTFTDSDGDGVIEVPDLPWGQYLVTEIQAPEGYDLDPTPELVTVGMSHLEDTVIVASEPVDGSLRILKRDDQGSPLGGATFAVTGPAYPIGITVVDGGANDADGTANGEIVLTGLPRGEYEIVETMAPEGYEPHPMPQQVILDATALEGEVTFVNTAKPGSLRILTRDDQGKPLGGAAFLVTGPSHPQGITVVDGGANDADGAADGKIELTGLPWGRYVVEETQAPEWYELDPTPQEVTLDPARLSHEFIFVNPLEVPLSGGTVRIRKVDDQGRLLGGARFVVGSWVLPETITVVDGGENDADGTANGRIVVTGLPWGEYVVSESLAPPGYDPQWEPQTQTISEDQPTAEFTFVNQPAAGTLQIFKHDDQGKALPGAAFKVTNTSFPQLSLEFTVVDGGENDEDGIANGTIKLTGLIRGTYRVEEIQAPGGYELDPTPQLKAIDDDQSTVDFTFVNQPVAVGSLRILKKDDEGRSLGGATFQVTGPSYPQGITVMDGGANDADGAADGKIELTGLAWGQYAITETQAPDGYRLEATPQQVTIDGSSLSEEVVFVNAPEEQGTVVIEKVDQHDGPVAGAQFELRDAENRVIASGSTGPNGRLVFEDIDPGTYTVVETAVPPGYEQADPASVAVTVAQDGTVEPDPVRMVNSKRPGSLRILKEDDEGRSLGGATFVVTGPSYPQGITVVDGGANDADGAADGKIELTGLAWGQYAITETQAPDGYRLDAVERQVTIDGSKLKETVRFVNVREVPGTVVVQKVDQYGGPLEGARFELRDDQGQVAEGVTSAEGILKFEDVKPGDYTVVEVEAPFGYEPGGEQSKAVRVELDGTVDPETLPFTNNKLQGSVTVLKLRAGTEQRLAGATFVLRDEEGAEIGRRTTDDSGEIVFSDLDPGAYSIEEISPPPGYRAADPASIAVTVAIVQGPGGPAVDVTPGVVVFENDARPTPQRPRVDLAVSKAVDDPAPEEGQQVTFTITVTNEGPDDAGGVVLRDLLPAGLTYVSHHAGRGTYDPDTGRWEVGALADDASATLAVTAVVDAGAAGRRLTNTVTLVSSSPSDGDSSNNRASAGVEPRQAVVTEEEPPAAEPPADEPPAPESPPGVEPPASESPGVQPPASGTEVTGADDAPAAGSPLPVTGGSAALLWIPGLAALVAGLFLRRRG